MTEKKNLILPKHSVCIAGHRTSISLEKAFWEELKSIAGSRGLSINQLIAEIDANRDCGLSTALRLFVLDTLKKKNS